MILFTIFFIDAILKKVNIIVGKCVSLSGDSFLKGFEIPEKMIEHEWKNQKKNWNP